MLLDFAMVAGAMTAGGIIMFACRWWRGSL
jgi:hypothetical protein